MPKKDKWDVEKRSAFLSPITPQGDAKKEGERDGTTALQSARLIDIDRIKADPNQHRKRFLKHTLESLAESIREAGGIIDPLTVEYNKAGDFFRIISGERRYRAAGIAGLKKLPCMVKEVDEKRRLILQLFANL